MEVIRTEALSPAWFEDKWLVCEQKVVHALSDMMRRVPLLGVFVVGAMAYQWYWLVHQFLPRFSPHFVDKIWLVSEPAFLLTLAFATAQVFSPKAQTIRVRTIVTSAIFAFAFAICWYRGLKDDTADIVSSLAICCLTLPLLLIALQVKGWLSRRGLILLLALEFAIVPVLMASALGTKSVLLNEAWYMIWTDRLIVAFAVALSEVWLSPMTTWASMFNWRTFSLLFNPISFFYVLPISHQHLKRHRAYEILLISAVILFLRVILVKVLNVPLENYLLTYSRSGLHIGPSLLWHGWLMYLEFFLFSYVGLNFGIVVGRCLGLDLEDGAHFSLLATTPHERWRRWNVYYYGWLFRFIFVPVFRRTRNVFFSIQIVFLVTYFLHASRLTVALLLPGLGAWWGWLFSKAYSQLFFFLLHGVIVYLSQYFPEWTLNNQLRRSWWGVLATHFLMALIHIVPLYYL